MRSRPGFATRVLQGVRRIAPFLALALSLSAAPLHGTPVTYNFSLAPTPYSALPPGTYIEPGTLYEQDSGTGSFTIDSAPAASGLSTYTYGSTSGPGTVLQGVTAQTYSHFVTATYDASNLSAHNSEKVVFTNGILTGIYFILDYSQLLFGPAYPYRIADISLFITGLGDEVGYSDTSQHSSISYGTVTNVVFTSSAVTPEPSSLLLLGTGIFAGVYRTFPSRKIRFVSVAA